MIKLSFIDHVVVLCKMIKKISELIYDIGEKLNLKDNHCHKKTIPKNFRKYKKT